MNPYLNTLAFLCLLTIIESRPRNHRFQLRFNGNRIYAERQSSEKEDLGGGYSTDNVNVYYEDKKIDGADPASFRWLDKYYAMDNFNLYEAGERIDDTDAQSFVYIGQRPTKDRNHVHWAGQILEDASPDTFKLRRSH